MRVLRQSSSDRHCSFIVYNTNTNTGHTGEGITTAHPLAQHYCSPRWGLCRSAHGQAYTADLANSVANTYSVSARTGTCRRAVNRINRAGGRRTCGLQQQGCSLAAGDGYAEYHVHSLLQQLRPITLLGALQEPVFQLANLTVRHQFLIATRTAH
jgi:hypothetical protein